MSDIYTASNVAQSASQGTSKRSNSGVAESLSDRFLSVLVAQMKFQNPLSPEDNGQITSQMAQISQLSQLGSIDKNLTALLSDRLGHQSAGGESFDAAISALGKMVSVDLPEGKPVKGLSGKTISWVGGNPDCRLKLKDETGKVLVDVFAGEAGNFAVPNLGNVSFSAEFSGKGEGFDASLAFKIESVSKSGGQVLIDGGGFSASWTGAEKVSLIS